MNTKESADYDLNTEKSRILFKIQSEVKQIKALTSSSLKVAKKELKADALKTFQKDTKLVLHAIKTISKQARILHFKGANKDTIVSLEGFLEEIKMMKRTLEDTMDFLKGA